jgi:hypothetical protein
MSRRDRMIGVALGILLGVLAVVAFVFLGGGASIDAPSIDAPTEVETQPPVSESGGTVGSGGDAGEGVEGE